MSKLGSASRCPGRLRRRSSQTSRIPLGIGGMRLHECLRLKTFREAHGQTAAPSTPATPSSKRRSPTSVLRSWVATCSAAIPAAGMPRSPGMLVGRGSAVSPSGVRAHASPARTPRHRGGTPSTSSPTGSSPRWPGRATLRAPGTSRSPAAPRRQCSTSPPASSTRCHSPRANPARAGERLFDGVGTDLHA